MQLPEFRNEPSTDLSRPDNQQAFQKALHAVERNVLGRTWPCWIGGETARAEESFESVDPGELTRLVGKFQRMTPEDAAVAVEKAHDAFPTWAATDIAERIAIFRAAAERLRERRHEFSALMCFEVGKSWAEADAETAEAIDLLEYYARQALHLALPQAVTPVPGEQNRMHYVPLGVGVVISPWNFPLSIMAGMTSATLLAGNTVVLKPASQAPAIAALWVELLQQSGLPAPVLNFVTGPGASTGAALVEHPQTRFVAFTGSRDVGLWIHEHAARPQAGQIWLKRVIAELGGKGGILVDADCDLDAAVAAVVTSAFGYQGQKCSACSRAIVHADVYDEFVRRLVPRVEGLRIGHAANLHTDLGPMVDGAARRKTMEYVEAGKQRWRLLTGGETGPSGGYYVQPTVFGDVAPDARIAQEEIFGPVLALLRVADFEQGLEVANGTEYGISGSVFTRDPGHKEEARRRFHVGNLYLNRKCTGAIVGGHPFGGFNMSGTDSKVGGPDYLLQFLQAKTISERIG